MSIFRSLNRFVILPAAGITCGFVTFGKTWPDDSNSLTLKDSTSESSKRQGAFKPLSITLQRQDILEKISKLHIFKELMKNENVKHEVQSENIPIGHRPYHVGQGQLFGPKKLEIDPLIFKDEVMKSLVIFYHLGSDLSNENNKIHKGILSLLLDEGLCYCGFPLLPSKRGVTAKLMLDFKKEIPSDTTVVLRAKVSELKGRKCVIKGTLEAVPKKNIFQYLCGIEPSHGETYVSAECILVEPKWFKYLNWLHIF
ncbi:MIOREX complex component 3 [Monosporozyma servazzii]